MFDYIPDDDRPFKFRERGRRDPVRVGALLGGLRHLNIPAKINEYRLKKAWAECVGGGIAKKASPLRLMGQTLHCNVQSSPWLSELSYQKPTIIERLNSSLGPGAVKDIVFRIGPVEGLSFNRNKHPQTNISLTPENERFIEKVTSGIADEGLKAVLKRVIGKSIGG